jgi:hypothetical protein
MKMKLAKTVRKLILVSFCCKYIVSFLRLVKFNCKAICSSVLPSVLSSVNSCRDALCVGIGERRLTFGHNL